MAKQRNKYPGFVPLRVFFGDLRDDGKPKFTELFLRGEGMVFLRAPAENHSVCQIVQARGEGVEKFLALKEARVEVPIAYLNGTADADLPKENAELAELIEELQERVVETLDYAKRVHAKRAEESGDESAIVEAVAGDRQEAVANS